VSEICLHISDSRPRQIFASALPNPAVLLMIPHTWRHAAVTSQFRIASRTPSHNFFDAPPTSQRYSHQPVGAIHLCSNPKECLPHRCLVQRFEPFHIGLLSATAPVIVGPRPCRRHSASARRRASTFSCSRRSSPSLDTRCGDTGIKPSRKLDARPAGKLSRAGGAMGKARRIIVIRGFTCVSAKLFSSG